MHPRLYELATMEEHNFRWRFRGALPPYEAFTRTIHDHVLVQFAVVAEGRGSHIVGHAMALDADLRDGYCNVGLVSDPNCHSVMEAVVLLVNYVFSHWPLRKIYFRVAEYNTVQYSRYLAHPLAEGIFQEEGRLRDHLYFDGRYWDEIIYSLYCENFNTWKSRFGQFFDNR